jgi:hypothetical protein
LYASIDGEARDARLRTKIFYVQYFSCTFIFSFETSSTKVLFQLYAQIIRIDTNWRITNSTVSSSWDSRTQYLSNYSTSIMCTCRLSVANKILNIRFITSWDEVAYRFAKPLSIRQLGSSRHNLSLDKL